MQDCTALDHIYNTNLMALATMPSVSSALGNPGRKRMISIGKLNTATPHVPFSHIKEADSKEGRTQLGSNVGKRYAGVGEVDAA